MEKQNGSRSIGKALKEYRSSNEMTQAKLACELDISPQYVGALERGEKLPAMEVFIHIAMVTGTSPNALLSDILGIYDDNSKREITSEFDGYSREQKKLILDTLEATCKIVRESCKIDM